jgi:hypothetical protein
MLTKTYFKESKMTEQNKQPSAEAGEGAVYMTFRRASNWQVSSKESYDAFNGTKRILYTSQTTATQAAVAAAMRGVQRLSKKEIMELRGRHPEGILHFANALMDKMVKSSIPAEANAALEKICMEVAEAVDAGSHLVWEDLRAIVTSAIEKGK